MTCWQAANAVEMCLYFFINNGWRKLPVSTIHDKWLICQRDWWRWQNELGSMWASASTIVLASLKALLMFPHFPSKKLITIWKILMAFEWLNIYNYYMYIARFYIIKVARTVKLMNNGIYSYFICRYNTMSILWCHNSNYIKRNNSRTGRQMKEL